MAQADRHDGRPLTIDIMSAWPSGRPRRREERAGHSSLTPTCAVYVARPTTSHTISCRSARDSQPPAIGAGIKWSVVIDQFGTPRNGEEVDDRQNQAQ